MPMKHSGMDAGTAVAAVNGGQRGRESVSLNARLRIGEAKRAARVRIRNVSPGGLMAEVPRPVAPDAAIAIELAGIGWITGRVAWQIEGRVGIAFESEIDPRLLRTAVEG